MWKRRLEKVSQRVWLKNGTICEVIASPLYRKAGDNFAVGALWGGGGRGRGGRFPIIYVFVPEWPE